MKEIPVSVGKTYAVTTAGSCTVTDADGRELCTAESGSQSYFTANGHAVTLSDDAATVTQVNFKQALAALSLLGGGEKLPKGYTRLEFLESTGTQGISVPYNFDKNTGIEVEGLFPLGYTSDMAVFIPLTSPKYVAVLYLASRGGTYKLVTTEYGTGLNGVEAQVNNLGKKATARYNWLGDKMLYVYNGETGTSLFNDKYVGDQKNSYVGILYNGRYGVYYSGFVFSVKLSQFDKVTLNMVPALDSDGTPCMLDLVTRKPFYNSGTGQFIAGIKDAGQLRTVLRKLPDLTGLDMGTLTLSIPAEVNTPEMQELLDSTEAQKNWEFTIQERAAAAATYSLRRVRKVVWVRKVSAENGSYVDADGHRWQAEWCSAIYSPRGNDPSLHGYEPFDSVEQAVEFWELQPYVDPNAEELSTIEA